MSASLLASTMGTIGLPSVAVMVLVGAACGAVGVWVLHFGQTILAESFSHALLPGVVAASLLGAGLMLGALVGVLAAYGLILLASNTPRTSSPTAISAAVSALVAGGALLATSGEGHEHFEELLFGDPVDAGGGEVLLALLLALGIALALWVFRERFSALAFDRPAAASLGVNVAWVSAAALGLLALSVAVAANVAGTLLALSFVTGPALGASMLTERLGAALWISAAAGGACAAFGSLLAELTDWPLSASVALTICLWVLLAPAANSLGGRRARLG